MRPTAPHAHPCQKSKYSASSRHHYMLVPHLEKWYTIDMNEIVVARFLSKVQKTESCWIWCGAKFPNGYGVFSATRLGLTTRYAHRWAHLLFKGAIKPGSVVCHTCDRRDCVNPDHLYCGSHADNTADMDRRGRRGYGAPGPGPNHHFAKYTPEICAQAWRMRDSGASHKEISAALNIKMGSMGEIMKRRGMSIWGGHQI